MLLRLYSSEQCNKVEILNKYDSVGYFVAHVQQVPTSTSLNKTLDIQLLKQKAKTSPQRGTALPQLGLPKISLLHPNTVTLLCAYCSVAKEKGEARQQKTGALPTNKEDQHVGKAVK